MIRCAPARSHNLTESRNEQVLIGMEYRPEHHTLANNVWNDVLESLKLVVYVENPFRGALNR